MSHVLSVRLSDDELQRLDWYAEQVGCTRSEALRKVLKKTPRIVIQNLRLDMDSAAVKGWQVSA